MVDMKKMLKEMMTDEEEGYELSGIGIAEEAQREALEESGKSEMDDAELEQIVGSELSDAISYVDSDLSPLRAQATRYYRGDLFGNEQEGQSKAVATEVRDTVNSILPSVMKVFFSSERLVEFMPRGPEDVQAAEQATDYVNYVIQQDNPGFEVLYSTFKDALIRKAGIVKAWWQETTDIRTERYTGLDELTVEMLRQEPNADVFVVSQKVTEVPGPDGVAVQVSAFDVDVKRRLTEGKIKIEAVPPEEFLLDRNARSLETAAIVAHRKLATVAELKAMGYDEEDINEHISGDADLTGNDEHLSRRAVTMMGMDTDSNNPEMQRVLYVESFIRIDYDGDGIPELRRVCTMGPGFKVVNNEPADFIPFADFVCDPEPHTSPLEATSIFDLTRDLQEIKSDILRSTLDSLAQAVNPRMAVVDGQVNVDDLLNNEVGAVIRMKQPGMVQPFLTPFAGQQAFPLIQYFDDVKENRTGLSKASMGLNADALQSTTRAAVAATISASAMRLELITRHLAEGVKKLFKLILQLTTVHQDKARVIRLRNQWVQVDPRAWASTMDVTINVALGIGDTEQKMQMLALIAGKQEQTLAQLGPMNPLASLAQYSVTLQKMVELAGFKDASQFFTRVDPNWQPPQMPPQPPIELQIAQMQLQADQQKFQAQTQLEIQKLQAQMQADQAKVQVQAQAKLQETQASLQLQASNDQRDAQREEAKAVYEAQLEQQRIEFERWKAELDAQTRIYIEQMKSAQAQPLDTNGDPNQINNALAEALDGLRAAVERMSAPRTIIRGPDGRAIGVQ